MRIAIGIEYDGSAFHGWQSQPFGRTIQDEVEKAVSSIAGKKIQVHAAGRTDKGVHAQAQVAHFDIDVARPVDAWVRGVNTQLPDSIAVLWAKEVAQEFHSRFSATARGYHYLLYNHPVRPALLHGKTGWFHHRLDVEKMRQGAELLLGEHDFSSFRAAECQANSPQRHLHRLDIEQRGDFFVFDLKANAFLHHMVRNIVGSLVYVGMGKRPPEWLGELLQQKNRSLAAPTFSPCGLYLAEVEYGSHWGLPGFPQRGFEFLAGADVPLVAGRELK